MSYALLCVATVAYLARRWRRARVRVVRAGGGWGAWAGEQRAER